MEIDCNYTDLITCPYCGYNWEDSWEFGSSGIIHCYNCFNDFGFESDYRVTYSTSKIGKEGEE